MISFRKLLRRRLCNGLLPLCLISLGLWGCSSRPVSPGGLRSTASANASIQNCAAHTSAQDLWQKVQTAQSSNKVALQAQSLLRTIKLTISDYEVSRLQVDGSNLPGPQANRLDLQLNSSLENFVQSHPLTTGQKINCHDSLQNPKAQTSRDLQHDTFETSCMVSHTDSNIENSEVKVSYDDSRKILKACVVRSLSLDQERPALNDVAVLTLHSCVAERSRKPLAAESFNKMYLELLKGPGTPSALIEGGVLVTDSEKLRRALMDRAESECLKK